MGGKLRPLGLIVGLVGAGFTFYALFSLFASLGCIASFDAGGCAAPVVSPTLVLPLGIILAVAGMLIGVTSYGDTFSNPELNPHPAAER